MKSIIYERLAIQIGRPNVIKIDDNIDVKVDHQTTITQTNSLLVCTC